MVIVCTFSVYHMPIVPLEVCCLDVCVQALQAQLSLLHGRSQQPSSADAAAAVLTAVMVQLKAAQEEMVLR